MGHHGDAGAARVERAEECREGGARVGREAGRCRRDAELRHLVPPLQQERSGGRCHDYREGRAVGQAVLGPGCADQGGQRLARSRRHGECAAFGFRRSLPGVDGFLLVRVPARFPLQPRWNLESRRRPAAAVLAEALVESLPRVHGPTRVAVFGGRLRVVGGAWWRRRRRANDLPLQCLLPRPACSSPGSPTAPGASA